MRKAYLIILILSIMSACTNTNDLTATIFLHQSHPLKLYPSQRPRPNLNRLTQLRLNL